MPEQPFAGALKPGIKLGKYEVREQLATGGMAIIYKAYDPTLDRYVAVKQIAPHLAQDERFLERFRTEAQTLAKLSASQANIVNVHELIQQDGQLFLVMECVEGTTLRVLMDRGPVPLQTSLGVLLSTALGLKAMHGQGIVHRDLTPSNIMMAKDGALKITDFGLIGHSGGKTSLPMGTTKYMAPEMFTGVPVDARADLYSLGMIAYEMLVGPEKFAEAFHDVLRDERAQQVRWMHWHSNPTLQAPALRDLQPGIPPLVSKIVERLMEKDPSKRFASAEQIIKWLRRIFVMHVQGKSISLKDSETLEKEIERDTVPVTAPAVRAAGGAAQAASSAGGAVAASDTGEKTAPLPTPKWTWKRAAFWAAVIGGPLILISAGLLTWKGYVTSQRKAEAEKVQKVADDLWDSKEYEAAWKAYNEMAEEFRDDLPSHSLYAWRRAAMAEAENALGKKEWNDADAAANRAERKYGASSVWVSDFRQRFNKAQDIAQYMKQVEAAVSQGDYEKAIAILTDLQPRYQELELSEQIATYREKRDLREYRRLVDEGKKHLADGLLDPARDSFLEAKAKRDGSEIDDLLAAVQRERDYRKVESLGQQAEADAKWGDAVGLYEEAYKILPSQALRNRINRCKVEELIVQAETLEKNGLTKEAIPFWTQVITLDPNNGKANAALKKAGQQAKLDGLVKAGKDAMGKSEWDQAINSYKEALKLLDDTQTDLKTQIEADIAEATYQGHVARGRELLQRKSFDEAEQEFTAAQTVKDTGEVQSLLTQVDTHRQYYGHLDVGVELFNQGDYAEALAALQKAQKVMDTQDARNRITDTNYQRYFAQGKSYFQDQRFTQALATLRIAQRYKNTVEIQAYIDLVQKAKAALESKKK